MDLTDRDLMYLAFALEGHISYMEKQGDQYKEAIPKYKALLEKINKEAMKRLK